MSVNVMSTSEASLDFRVPSKPHVSRAVRAAVADFSREHGVGDDDLEHFLAAFGEALANAIEHSGSGRPIEIQIKIASDSLVAVVRDFGIGFEAARAEEPLLPDPHAERGRGLPIMRHCCDIFSVQSVRGIGTTVRIGRSLATARANGTSAGPTHAA